MYSSVSCLVFMTLGAQQGAEVTGALPILSALAQHSSLRSGAAVDEHGVPTGATLGVRHIFHVAFPLRSIHNNSLGVLKIPW